ncbi:MAG: HK97 family phage prohead protease [Candidatus Nanopelagicales bacterium]
MSRDSIEIRVRADRVEFRDAAAGSAAVGVLAGYAAVYERLSQNLGGFVEKVAHGAFAQSLADNNPVLARYNHDDNQLLGTTEAETLRVSSDETGLPYDVDLPDTSVGRDVAVLAKRGDVRYSSFAFRTLEDAWSVTDQGFPLRTLIKVQLVDVAPVNNPAYRDTSVGMRSLAERTGIDPADLTTVGVEEIRARLLKDAAERAEQDAEDLGDTRSLLGLRKRALELEHLR